MSATKKLTAATVLKLAAKKWGKAAAIEDNTRRRGPSSPEQRASAAEARKKNPRPIWKELKDWPADATVGEYRDALAKYTADRKAWEKSDSWLRFHEYYKSKRILTVEGLSGFQFSDTKGEGDTWEEAAKAAGLISDDE